MNLTPTIAKLKELQLIVSRQATLAIRAINKKRLYKQSLAPLSGFRLSAYGVERGVPRYRFESDRSYKLRLDKQLRNYKIHQIEGSNLDRYGMVGGVSRFKFNGGSWTLNTTGRPRPHPKSPLHPRIPQHLAMWNPKMESDFNYRWRMISKLMAAFGINYSLLTAN